MQTGSPDRKALPQGQTQSSVVFFGMSSAPLRVALAHGRGAGTREKIRVRAGIARRQPGATERKTQRVGGETCALQIFRFTE